MIETFVVYFARRMGVQFPGTTIFFVKLVLVERQCCITRHRAPVSKPMAC
jgi:hypothetical protein